ncbi:MAG: ACP S-malonyltransferase [Spirulina sp.]
MNFLVDYNLGKHTELLLGNLASQGWLELFPIRFVTFKEIDLPIDSSDRIVWRLAQENQMILLTANRSMKGEDSLEQVIREENTMESLPVITIGNADRFLVDRIYRNRCIDSILEILLDIEIWIGVGRIFVPR